MGWESGNAGGTGEEPDPGSGLPGGHSDPSTGASRSADGAARDPRLAGFVKGGEWDTCPPSAALAAAVEGVSGPEWRCPGATHDELLGMLRRCQALESWAVSAKLGMLRALIRDDDPGLPGIPRHGDLPAEWSRSLAHEVALALSMPAVSAQNLLWAAWDLEARLPGTGGLLAAGELTFPKAKAVEAALMLLSDEDAARAEAMILPELSGKTYSQVDKLAVQAAITVDPESAVRRREDAEQNKARVQLSREDSGAAALSGRDLPAGQTLTAHAQVCARAAQYKDSGAFPADTRVDQYRAAAFLDLLNGITAEARIASGQVITPTPGSAAPDADAAREQDAAGSGEAGGDCSCHECGGGCLPPQDDGDDPDWDDPDGNDDPGNDGPESEGPSGRGPGGSGSPGSPGSGAGPGSSGGLGGGSHSGSQPGEPAAQPRAIPPQPPPESPPKLADLVFPLATLLGLAERPGEGYGLGPLDPDLCRALAASAISSRYSRVCVTVTGPGGIAIGHGCARLTRRGSPRDRPGSTPCQNAQGAPGTLLPLALPARASLTITAARLTELAAAAGPPGPAPWSFTADTDPGPPGGYGTWTLTLPDRRNLTVKLEPVPTLDCDHRHESHAYQPNDTLRHLVQIRDGECTFPPCSRHAKDSDFEHAVPYDKGGKTCACNAGARSRQCHQVKQTPGWTVTQPKPGWHQWQTPSGRVYTQGPKRYPV